MRHILLVLVGCAVVATGCVRREQFRFVQLQPECFGGDDPVPGVDGEKRLWPSVECRHTLYSVGFIEFDQRGRFIDPEQERKALSLIDQARTKSSNGRIIAVVYVHGWKNNASEAMQGGKPKDVERFQSALLELGYRSREAARRVGGGATPIPVVGVYMGWRGKSLMGPSWFTFISFWGRRNTANQVGNGPDLATALTHVIDKVNDGGTGSRVVLVGHSFGARVLEHAIETRSVPLYKSTEATSALEPLVDLTLYVNSANDARLSMARVQALRDRPIQVRHPDFDPARCQRAEEAGTARCRDYPLLVAITSRGDLATKYLLPTANTLNLDDSATAPTPPTGTFVDRIPSAAVYKRSAAGHVTFLQSHIVHPVACPEPAGATPAARRESMLRPVCAKEDEPCRFVFRTPSERPVCFQADQRSGVEMSGARREPFNRTAFWIMDVDPVVIKDHGDIWNLSFVEMLAQLMAPRGFFEPNLGRVQLRVTRP
jgi:pimeloyl-ACP methyl ester carboxylesterase